MNAEAADDWYEVVAPGDPLRQGQILPNFSLLQATFRFLSNDAPEVETLPITKVITLSQSCDLFRPEKDENGVNKHNVLVAPLVPFGKAHVKNAANYAKGRMLQYHLLPENAAFGMSYSIIAFPLATSVPYDIVTEHAQSNRCIRLRSPYLEDLASRFGTLFLRVALPEPPLNLPAFEKMVDALKKSTPPRSASPTV